MRRGSFTNDNKEGTGRPERDERRIEVTRRPRLRKIPARSGDVLIAETNLLPQQADCAAEERAAQPGAG